mmetsp:Transcript_27367/g.61875  ORF Transcript_27367/g.61875 Transcript_27367/m.61875 type:complete len:201 (-) Transcript_27367:268-870(-)
MLHTVPRALTRPWHSHAASSNRMPRTRARCSLCSTWLLPSGSACRPCPCPRRAGTGPCCRSGTWASTTRPGRCPSHRCGHTTRILRRRAVPGSSCTTRLLPRGDLRARVSGGCARLLLVEDDHRREAPHRRDLLLEFQVGEAEAHDCYIKVLHGGGVEAFALDFDHFDTLHHVSHHVERFPRILVVVARTDHVAIFRHAV